MQNNKLFAKFAKYSGLLALLIYVITCVIIVVVNYQDSSYTISRHIGVSPVSIVVFAVADTIATGLLAFNMFYHSRKRWDFGRVFVAYAAITAACLAIIGWFPHVDGGSAVITIIHRVSAWFVIFLTPVFAFVFLRKSREKSGGLFRVLLAIFIVEAVAFALVAVAVPEFFFASSLYLESLYLVSLVALTQVLAFAPTQRTNPEKMC